MCALCSALGLMCWGVLLFSPPSRSSTAFIDAGICDLGSHVSATLLGMDGAARHRALPPSAASSMYEGSGLTLLRV